MRRYFTVESFHFLFVGARVVTNFSQVGGLAIFSDDSLTGVRELGYVAFFGFKFG